MKRPTLVILSGGLDSTVLAHYIDKSITETEYCLIGCVSVNYGQRHQYELECARRTCNDLKVPHYLIDLHKLGPIINASALTGDQKVPEGHYAEESMKATVVPNRNMILIALAVAVGITHKAHHVAYGAHAGDHAIYPDCRPQFADALGKAIELCDYEPPTLVRPFINWQKADIVKCGVKLGVNWNRTWTCYQGADKFSRDPVACGRCGTCVERLEAFSIAGVEDPIKYRDRVFWKTALAPK